MISEIPSLVVTALVVLRILHTFLCWTPLYLSLKWQCHCIFLWGGGICFWTPHHIHRGCLWVPRHDWGGRHQVLWHDQGVCPEIPVMARKIFYWLPCASWYDSTVRFMALLWSPLHSTSYLSFCYFSLPPSPSWTLYIQYIIFFIYIVVLCGIMSSMSHPLRNKSIIKRFNFKPSF